MKSHRLGELNAQLSRNHYHYHENNDFVYKKKNLFC